MWLDDNQVTWWKTPPESPDLNPIENMWHELKEFIRHDKLIRGIINFWKTVDVSKCVKYINHLRKVIPKVIELDGATTGY